MSRDVLYCIECGAQFGARLNPYVVSICARCHFDMTGEDEERDAREHRMGLGGSESSPNEEEA